MSSVIEDLKQWGPDDSYERMSSLQAQTYTWNLATSHYENFPVISWAVPKRLRQHFANVYAFCRWADDLGDEIESTKESLWLLEWWQVELGKCYRNESQHPVYVALHETIQKFSIPVEHFSALISAFVQDQTVTEYETYDQLLNYCTRSANPVGRIILCLCAQSSDENVAHSDSICTGLQLTNFWQDVSRDYQIGRIYLPREDRLRFGVTDQQMQSQRISPEFRDLLEFEVERARMLLVSGKPLVAAMPGRMKIDIDLFIRGGLLVLDGIQRINFDVWDQRPVVRKPQLFVAAVKSLGNLLSFR
ncbi:MAG: squalene synthase HpnC [Planctomicrobium sp.]|jgi:squalene synthase HpnC|nr:squalene synthase HpnC [Planctomicrobium sp.]